MSITASMVAANLVGVLIFLFLLWKRLKEDYHFERVFGLGFFILLGGLLGLLLSVNFYLAGWFWIVAVGLFAGYLIGKVKQKVNFFESFEAFILGMLPWLSLIFISDSIKNSSLYSFLSFWLCLCLFVLFFYLDGNYKKYSWYHSGRVGFAGLFVGIIFFISRAVAAAFNLPVLSFMGQIDIVFSSLTTVIFMVMLYELTRQ
jgi:hypothetical protein